MRHINNVDPITNLQNNGGCCPSCGSRWGHYNICLTIGGSFEPKPIAVPVPAVGDHLLLHALGITWEGDYR